MEGTETLQGSIADLSMAHLAEHETIGCYHQVAGLNADSGKILEYKDGTLNGQQIG